MPYFDSSVERILNQLLSFYSIIEYFPCSSKINMIAKDLNTID